MKKTIKIISMILGIAFLSVSACYLVFATDENLLAYNKVETEMVSALEGWTKTYSLSSPGTTASSVMSTLNAKLKGNSVTGSKAESYISGGNGILNAYNNIYCAKHKKGLSNAGSPIIKGPHIFTENMNTHITFDENSSDPVLNSNPTIFKDRCEAGQPESGGNTASNFHVKIYASGCDLKNISSPYGIDEKDSNVIPYAIAFNDKTSGMKYGNSKTQQAIWGITGNQCGGCSSHSGSGKETTLYKAGKAVDDYEAQAEKHGKNPEITVGGNAGTVLADGGTSAYRIGPFTMSDYAYAYSENVKEYSGKDVSKYKGLIGGIDGMQITVKNDSGNLTSLDVNNSTVKIVYKDWYGNATSKGERNRNTGVYTTKIPTDENIYPSPKSTFYIDVQRSAVPEDSTLVEISLSYRSTETSGKGDVLISRYAKTSFTVEDTGDAGCGTYYCTDHNPGYATHAESPRGGSQTCTYQWTCYNHDEGCGCGGHYIEGCSMVYDERTEQYVSKCSGDHTWDWCKCNCDGHADEHEVVFKCTHGHEDCNISDWKAGTPTIGMGQPILVATTAECTVKSTVKNITLSIRMTTDIVIKKYVKEVKHDTDGKITFGQNNVGGVLGATQTPEDRKNKKDSEKESNPVYAEYGDIITYQIDVINSQKCEVKLQLKDILPKNIKVISREFKDNTVLNIPGNKTTSYLIVVRTDANDNQLYVNEVKLITRNLPLTKDESDNVDFIRTTDSYSGPVVNIAEINNIDNIVSKEYFKINDYNISIDKYISKYNAEMMNSNNSNDFTNETYILEDRSNKDIDYKSKHPFPVEQTETFVYSIKLTNNSQKGDGNKVATQIRPTSVTDSLDTGLEVISITAKIVDKDGNTKLKLNNTSYSVIQKENNKQEFTLTLANKQDKEYLVIDPSDSLVYEVLVEVTESNLYLNSLENTANIVILTNINNGKDNSKEQNICTTCSGTGEEIYTEKCTNEKCIEGKITETEICPECLGKGKCSQCDGTGKEIKNCDHNLEHVQIMYKCTACGWLEAYEPEICNGPLEEGECGSTTFIDVCTECNKEKSTCTHYKYTCTSCNTEYNQPLVSCTNPVECGGTNYTTKCTICNNAGNTCNHIGYECDTCKYFSTTEFTKCPNPKETNSNEKCNGETIVQKCSNCKEVPALCVCYEYTCTKCNMSVFGTKVAPTQCHNTILCEESIFNKICTNCNADASACTHFDKKCANCGTSVTEETTECTKIIDPFCTNTEFVKECSRCLNNPDNGVSTYEEVCTKCNGTRATLEDAINCTNCSNTGKINLEKTCDTCLGSSKVEKQKTCTSCNGSGKINNTTSADRIVRKADGSLNRNTNTRETDSEYVKMKDLVISGKVWLDRNKDGTIGVNSNNKLETGNDSIDVESNPSTYIEDTTGKEYAMKGIAVRLYTSDGTLVRITETDENGLFTFARKDDLDEQEDDYYAGEYSRSENGVVESEQRIPKATNKDENKNYTSNSKMISYYVEYEYDGLVYKSTEIYAGSTNLNEDDSLKPGVAYKYDSNAYEFDNVRKTFNKKYEVIGFDKGYNGDLSYTEKLEYDKQNHYSYIIENDARKMTARSFIDIENQSTNYLWLHQQTTYDKPETEYLKYINLGLEEREDIDINITQDLYEIKTTVNGEEMIYEYNQNDYTLGNEKIDKAQYTDERFNSELYMTGYTDDTSTLLPYEFWLYNSDYNYKVSQYNTETVRNYKGTESELNVETTFRIKVTNNSITDDEPYLEDGKKDIKVYTGINEIAEFYDNQYVDLEFDEEGNVKTFYVKTKDENGYLVNTPLGVVKAEYVKRDGTRQEAVLSNKSIYNPENGGIRTLKDSEGNNLYSTLYIRPKVAEGEKLAGNVILEEGESVDILITFVIDKFLGNMDNELLDDELYVYVDEMMSVGEITSYSTYYKKEDGTYYSAGLVDKDSNPGNFGELYGLPSNKNVDSQEYLAIYEDDTFKMGINVFLQTFENDRAITGFVWDDARTEIADDGKGKQYIGDGIYNPNINAVEKQPDAKRNEDVSNKEETDIVIKDMKTQLIEMVRVPIKDASGNLLEERVYEETIYACGEKSQMTMNTDAEGKYMLKGYIPGDYIVKFFYGHDVNSESMIIFNGQDYKSTKYQAEQEGKSKPYAEYQANSDLLLEKLEEENISDAKDDEIKRLEAISYSEVMNNDLNNVLRGKNSSNKQYLISNTNMESETITFLVRPEKEKLEKKSLTYEEAITRFNTITRHPIKNVDFGIEYRPELQVSLNKYIANITITTSDANGENSGVPLVDARFNEYYGIVVKTDHDTGITTFLADQNGEVIRVPENASNTDVETAVSSAGETIPEGIKDSSGRYVITIAGTELDTDNSIGLSNLQYVENIDDIQGFAYLNIDDEIMQGSRIAIKYLFVGNNLSEVDRVSSNLSELRFKENDAAIAYRGDSDKFYDEVSFQLGDNTGFIDADYSGARTARNRLFNEYYGYELNESNEIKKDKLGSDIRYRKKAKKIEVDENKKVIKDTFRNDATYYGRYLGSLYYTGIIGHNDIVAEVKIDKILDYIDNDLVFEAKNNNSSNNLWKATTSSELLSDKLVNGNSFITLGAGNSSNPGLIGLSGKYLLDSKNRAYDTNEKSNLALLQDDRIKDYENEADDKTINKDISRFLLPRVSDSNESYGKVNLVATKVVSAEELTEDMNYDNIGEIVQYSSITGRVTPFTTTLGNVSFFEQNDDGTLKKDHDGDYIPVKEWDEAQTESDTSATELITLTPPTGLGRVQRVVRDTVEKASYVVIAIVVVAVIDLAIMVGLILYRKRRIK